VRSGKITVLPIFLMRRPSSPSTLARSSTLTGGPQVFVPAVMREVKTATSAAPSREPPYQSASKSPLGNTLTMLQWTWASWAFGETQPRSNRGVPTSPTLWGARAQGAEAGSSARGGLTLIGAEYFTAAPPATRVTAIHASRWTGLSLEGRDRTTGIAD
jgi:hypothetical protein